MVAVNYNFDIEKGSDFEISFIYTDENGTPVNLNFDRCVKFSLSGIDSNFSSSYINETLDPINNNPISILTADSSGVITLKLSAIETNKYNFDTAIYDLDVSLSNSPYNKRLSTGLINIINRNFPLVISDNIIECSAVSSDQNGDTPGPTPTPPPSDIVDFCLPYDCVVPDLFADTYNASGFFIQDFNQNSTISSGSVTVTNTGIISNVELAINGLSHNHPSDLIFILAPPSGDKILLSANHKILNYNNNFSFMFSNKADTDKYLFNITNGNFCNIYDKTSLINYNNENLLSSFDHLFGSSVTGIWTLIAKDTDPVGSGSINSWKLVITTEPTA
jgi:subtilisin-like proprotein convertase family protein